MKWSEEFPPNDNCHYNHVVYSCPILGDIFISWKGWKEYDSYDCYIMGESTFETIICVSGRCLDEAKNAVEEQYTTLLQSALEKLNEPTTTT